jgi:hypothetical protein
LNTKNKEAKLFGNGILFGGKMKKIVFKQILTKHNITRHGLDWLGHISTCRL